MKVKKYVASSMAEAMQKIRHELGNEAVILNSKEIETGGFLGFFTKKNIEVIAAIDKTPTIKKPERPRERPSPSEQLVREKRQTPPTTPKRPVRLEKNESELISEINELKNIVKGMTQSGREGSEEYPPLLQEWNDWLISQDVTHTIRLHVMKALLKKWYIAEDEGVTKANVDTWFQQTLSEMISGLDMGGIRFNKKFVNIVGPTGVGKTTTIAKIAAHCVLKKEKRVALITTDTYRIAAVEQLKTYAKILNVPIEVAYSIDDFKAAKEKFSSYDLVLVDSAGRNFRNQLYIDELKKVIDFTDEMDTYLTLSLTSKYTDMKAIYEQFSLISIDKVIFTKKDETASYGALLNLLVDYNVGVAYITTGQNVPDDIIEASKEGVIAMLYEVDNHE
ncbi:flagellar biosynthesis protein FlhF [Desertibacillus haloalkaliphilus]|uniref:flagellar biosynthesis protein FlhF n=1 Tax=Desertibacillus haloalkaliphilus TaxID=1328930 RepID=UPI001C2630FC|nr:flagellar biosynthesis protein FlhF [Desertibacillus haloalkaliphilus]MBU8906994.1 flagellar biosynthesis protein FlhF [Desertibacillus haloalkaliphilus]